jgi:putative ABC transport system permease protein
MRFTDLLRTALGEIFANKLRSFFTLLGIMVSVTFLVAVVAIIQGMNAYVKENIGNAVVGANAFQVRRTPLQVGQIDEEMWKRVQRRPLITLADVDVVKSAIPDAQAIGITTGFPPQTSDVVWGDQTLSGVTIYGITPPYQEVQDYQIDQGEPLADVDVQERRPVAVIGHDVATQLFPNTDPVGQQVYIGGQLFTIVGVAAAKGSLLGQSFDGFALIPFTRYEMLYGRNSTTIISVKMADAAAIAPAMQRAEEAMRLAHHLRPSQEDNFSVETADALIDFWKKLTAVLFSVVPAMVAIGVVVGGIVIMNIMLMAVTERTREIGIRKAIGAKSRDVERQFLVESVMLSALGGVLGVLAGWGAAEGVAAFSPLPARITLWSVAVAIALGAGVGVLFGVYPASRAAKLDPITALRAE